MGDTVCLDFDGVVHSYTSGWQGADVIPDPPTNGAKLAVDWMRAHGYRVVIYSARSGQAGGIQAMRNWLALHRIIVDELPHYKPPAMVYVDDRAIQFNGDWVDCINEVAGFKTWQEKEKGKC